MTDNLQLIKVDYDTDLNSKQKEIYNFQKVAAELADFLAYHKDGEITLKIQLKGRLTIAEKYKKHDDLYMCFPIKNSDEKLWYLISHKELLEKVKDTTPWLNSARWLQKGHYSSQSPSKELIHAIRHSQL